MIAYNYSYDTCLGRITPFQGRYKFGVTDLNIPKGAYELLRDDINGKLVRPSVSFMAMNHALQYRQMGLPTSSSAFGAAFSGGCSRSFWIRA